MLASLGKRHPAAPARRAQGRAERGSLARRLEILIRGYPSTPRIDTNPISPDIPRPGTASPCAQSPAEQISGHVLTAAMQLSATLPSELAQAKYCTSTSVEQKSVPEVVALVKSPPAQSQSLAEQDPPPPVVPLSEQESASAVEAAMHESATLPSDAWHE